ncbi:MAG: aminotransferase class III-fold pyridoxal phosphate-dependent enzyme [Spirochaetales bacterium]|nr:aminotransferase class III-fold pyridoxal phosphate-dependent enzyme [Spirochaetales bacterium]
MQHAKTGHLLFTAHRPDLVFSRGKGSYLWDTSGRKYLDCINGWAVNCYGHSPAFLAKALYRQTRTLVNASPSFFNETMITFAEMLCEASGLDKAFFCATGAEANEGAIKLARKYGALKKNGAFEIITFTNSFHGRTLAAMSASGKAAFKPLFEPKVPGFIHVPINDFDALKKAVSAATCALMLEPVQGEGGVYEVDPVFLKKAAALCREQGVLLVFDEIQTGLCRTGALFCFEHYGILPDILTLGKGIGGGYPLAALLCREGLDIFEAGDQGGTYSAVSLSMAAGISILSRMRADRLWENAARMGLMITRRLESLAARYPLTNIRGKGLLLAFDLKGEDTKTFVEVCRGKGLLLNSPQPGVIRLMPALNIQERHIKELFTILENVLKEWFSRT